MSGMLAGGGALIIREVCGSTGGINTSEWTHTKIYDVSRPVGNTDELTSDEMIAGIVEVAPDPLYGIDGLRLNDIQYREDDDTDHWLFTCQWNLRPPEGKLRWAFDTTGGTVRMYTSKNTVRYPATGRTAPDFKGAIGVKSTGSDTEPEGVDVVVPVLKLSASFRHPKNTIDLDYVRSMSGLAGRTNNDTFYGFAAGELLFLGCVGELVPDIPTDIRYEFAASENATGITIGSIAGIAKKGHDYLWICFEPEQDTSAKKLAQRPLAAYVERVYDQLDFSVLGVGTV